MAVPFTLARQRFFKFDYFYSWFTLPDPDSDSYSDSDCRRNVTLHRVSFRFPSQLPSTGMGLKSWLKLESASVNVKKHIWWMWHCLRFRCGNTDGTHRLRADSQNTVHSDRRRQREPSAHIHCHCARRGHQHQRSQSSVRSGTYSQESHALLTRLKSTRETYSFQWKCLYTGYTSFWNFANFDCSNFT